MLEFLPEKSYLDGSFDVIYEKLYRIFEADLIDKPLHYKGRRVQFDKRKIDSPYEEGFWHITTRGKTERIPDYKRAKRIAWLRPLIEHSNDRRLYKWIEDDTDRRGYRTEKTHIWYREGKYLVVISDTPDRPRDYFLVTAFYVTGSRNEEYYLKRYNKAQKKGPEC